MPGFIGYHTIKNNGTGKPDPVFLYNKDIENPLLVLENRIFEIKFMNIPNLKTMKIFFTSVLYFALNSNMFSQCVMGGDLTTRRLSGYYFEFILTIISDTNCECTDVFVISFGDGSSQILTRTSTISLPDSNSKDIYKAIHTYPGPGIFSVVVTGCNWVPDINNIVNSGSEQFKAFNNLSINASFTNNNTPVLIYPGYDIATVNHVFVYNPVAYDTDGDSLSYGLEHCYVQIIVFHRQISLP